MISLRLSSATIIQLRSKESLPPDTVPPQTFAPRSEQLARGLVWDQLRQWVHNYSGRQDFSLTRWLFLRLLGLIYLCAFASLWGQLRALIGGHGLLPAVEFLSAVEASTGPARFTLLPTLAWLDASDAFLQFLCGAGVVLSLLLMVGVLPVPTLVLLWLVYLSLVNIGQDFLSFQWDVLLLETGFLAIFWAPPGVFPSPKHEAPPSLVGLWLLRWLLFRLMFFSGLVKLASGDPVWRNLTALSYHYQTQPLPTPLAWYLHQLPLSFHKLSTGFTFVVELIVPFGIFAPRRLRFVAAGLLISLQVLIMASGNYTFFNLLTIVLCLTLFDDAALRRILPNRLALWETATQPPAGLRLQRWLATVLAIVVLTISAVQCMNLLLPRVGLPEPAYLLVDWLEPFHLVNSYGLFAVMTTERPEIVIEGSDDGKTWRAYEFAYKPGDVRRAPRWVAPYQPRLDWQMWFVALESAQTMPWFTPLLQHLLKGDHDVLALLATNPFPQQPPHYIRALRYNYRFTDYATAGSEGTWWRRELRDEYFPAISLRQ